MKTKFSPSIVMMWIVFCTERLGKQQTTTTQIICRIRIICTAIYTRFFILVVYMTLLKM